MMALKMRGSINNAAKAKDRVVAEAKKKATEEEKKMSVLQQLVNKIRKVKLDEHNWPKYWVKLREWEKSENAGNMIARIKSYLNAPIIDNFGTLKEEESKSLVSRYHDGEIWLDQPIAITWKLINWPPPQRRSCSSQFQEPYLT
jgi:valyl-tRNA synthetase